MGLASPWVSEPPCGDGSRTIIFLKHQESHLGSWAFVGMDAYVYPVGDGDEAERWRYKKESNSKRQVVSYHIYRKEALITRLGIREGFPSHKSAEPQTR